MNIKTNPARNREAIPLRHPLMYVMAQEDNPISHGLASATLTIPPAANRQAGLEHRPKNPSSIEVLGASDSQHQHHEPSYFERPFPHLPHDFLYQPVGCRMTARRQSLSQDNSLVWRHLCWVCRN